MVEDSMRVVKKRMPNELMVSNKTARAQPKTAPGGSIGIGQDSIPR